MATILDLIPGVVKLLGNRSDVGNLAAQALADTIVEFTDNYPFEELRENGPLVQFIAGQNQYSSNYFLLSGTPTPLNVPRVFNKVISWFFYLQPPVNLSINPLTGSSNPGYNLTFRDIEDLEVLANTLTMPMFWSQLGANLYVAATPQQAYFTYMRYQYKHTFPFPASSVSPIAIPQTWYDIAQYAAAERIALQLRMQDVADRYHRILFGDPEFERSSGGRGQPGLIARRTSQTQKNQSRSTRSVRVIRSSY